MQAPVAFGDRLIVETGVWSSGAATAKSVSDSGGDTFTELLHYKAPDNTEMAVWSAPITGSGGTTPTITVTPTAKADVGAAVLDYYGLSAAVDATVLDQMAHASGITGSGTSTVSSGPTPATTAGNELALGFYTDSGFHDTLVAGSGFSPRVNVSNDGDIELLTEDAAVTGGATPAATGTTGAKTDWLMATIVFKSAAGSQALANFATGLSAPATGARAPTALTDTIRAVRRHEIATKTAVDRRLGRAPSRHHGGRKHRVRAREFAACAKVSPAAARRSCVSLHRAAAISKRDKRQFIYQALLRNLSPGLFCRHIGAQTLKGIVSLSSGWFA